jgi:hypothetical protein
METAKLNKTLAQIEDDLLQEKRKIDLQLEAISLLKGVDKNANHNTLSKPEQKIFDAVLYKSGTRREIKSTLIDLGSAQNEDKAEGLLKNHLLNVLKKGFIVGADVDGKPRNMIYSVVEK